MSNTPTTDGDRGKRFNSIFDRFIKLGQSEGGQLPPLQQPDMD